MIKGVKFSEEFNMFWMDGGYQLLLVMYVSGAVVFDVEIKWICERKNDFQWYVVRSLINSVSAKIFLQNQFSRSFAGG